MLPDSQSKGKDSVDLIRDSLFAIQVEKPWLLLQFGNSDTEEIGADRVEALVSASPSDEDGETRENVVKTEIEDNDNDNLTIPHGQSRFLRYRCSRTAITATVFLPVSKTGCHG